MYRPQKGNSGVSFNDTLLNFPALKLYYLFPHNIFVVPSNFKPFSFIITSIKKAIKRLIF